MQNIDSENRYYIYKNDELNKITISFPGTEKYPQLISELIGSFFYCPFFPFCNDNIKNGVMIHKYFGNRTEEILSKVFSEENKERMNLNQEDEEEN